MRGAGLLLGIDIVSDFEKKTPDPTSCAKIMERMKALGILVGKGGSHGNVLRVKPPMIFSHEDA